MIDRQWLEDNYVSGQVTFADLAELVGGRSRAYRLLKKENVVKRKTISGFQIDRNALRSRYLDELKSVEDIAVEFGCSTSLIKELCSRHGFLRGSEFKRSSDGRSRYSGRKCSSETKLRMSNSKSQLSDGYTRWGQNGRKYIHRKIAEEILERKLGRNEVVHHMDMRKENHHPSNLIVIERDTHGALHIVLRRLPGMNQVEWLKKNGFKVEELNENDYQKSETLRRWLGATQGEDAMGAD